MTEQPSPHRHGRDELDADALPPSFEVDRGRISLHGDDESWDGNVPAGDARLAIDGHGVPLSEISRSSRS
jgi:hypothetical protein